MITKLTTNLKSDATWTCRLYSKTLIVGDSASGKSAITQAVELALSGRLTDFQGRGDSAQRTVQEAITSAPELVAVVDDSADVLSFRLMKAALTSEGMSALSTIGRTFLSPEDLVKLTEFEAFEKRARDAAKEVRELEQVRNRVDAWESTTNENRAALSDRILAASREHDDAKSAASGLQSQLWPELTRIVDRTTKAASQLYVPASLGELVIDTGTPQSPKCRVGLKVSDAPHRFGLSGAEWNIAVTALALAWSGGVVIPDDRAISRKLLFEWMTHLADSQSQILLTCIEPPDKVPTGWTVIKVTSPGKVSKWQPSRRSPASTKRPRSSKSRRATSTASSAKSASKRSGTRRGAGK